MNEFSVNSDTDEMKNHNNTTIFPKNLQKLVFDQWFSGDPLEILFRPDMVPIKFYTTFYLEIVT